jgi:hypothetical protein
VFFVWSAAIYRRFCFSVFCLPHRAAIARVARLSQHGVKEKQERNKSGDKSPHSKSRKNKETKAASKRRTPKAFRRP